MEMFFVFFILGIGIYLIYFLVKKGSKETIPTKSVTKNLPDEVLKREYMGLREMFVNGEMSNKMATELILKKDEYLIFDIPNVSICEERAIKTKGSTKSVRVRVMKGVSVGEML